MLEDEEARQTQQATREGMYLTLSSRRAVLTFWRMLGTWICAVSIVNTATLGTTDLTPTAPVVTTDTKPIDGRKQ